MDAVPDEASDCCAIPAFDALRIKHCSENLVSRTEPLGLAVILLDDDDDSLHHSSSLKLLIIIILKK